MLLVLASDYSRFCEYIYGGEVEFGEPKSILRPKSILVENWLLVTLSSWEARGEL